MTNPKPEASLIRSIASAGGYDTIAGLAEVAIDAITESGALREIPIIGSLLGLGRAGIAVRDCLLLRKIGTFLLELNSISAVDREAFVQQMDKDPAERDKIGVHLMVLL